MIDLLIINLMAKKSTTPKSRKTTKKSQPKVVAKPVPAWSRVASQVVDFFKNIYAKVVSYLK